MNKAEMLKLLRTKRRVFVYTTYNANKGAYLELIKSRFIKEVKGMGEVTDFSNIVSTDTIIYIN